MWYAHFLVAMRRFDESGAEARRAIELDPYSEFIRGMSIWSVYLARHYDDALQQSASRCGFSLRSHGLTTIPA